MLSEKFGISFAELYDHQGLKKLDDLFLKHLNVNYPNEYHSLMLARSENLERLTQSNIIIAVAPLLEDFIVELFMIPKEFEILQRRNNSLTPIFQIKRKFVQRQVAKKYAAPFVEDISIAKNYLVQHKINPHDELQFAIFTQDALDADNQQAIEMLTLYTAWALYNPEGIIAHKSGVLFKIPKKTHPEHLLEIMPVNQHLVKPLSLLEQRNGFNHHDSQLNITNALDHANYCIYCHNQDKDSCSKGLKNDENLKGCPLDEKISEMNLLRAEGSIIGALAVIAIDNPMMAATGHRICNDCMKSCIYQKQEPVNIPLSETQTLDDVLELPFGFEIYSLLTRWNPLNFKAPLPLVPSGHKVLVAGLGPAGFTASHYLLNQGFTVVGIDGLKIEPLSSHLSGITPYGERVPFSPIKDVKQIFSPLSERIAQGFGGVMEYGITTRWNKNYLTLIRLLLERRDNFRMYGGIRLGSNLTLQQIWELGFDHVTLALGAGKPNIPHINNAVAKGVRTASDFLMSLQLTGAVRKDSIANLQIRLPIVVIGGGLTAVDAATEALAYYPQQVAKIYQRYSEVQGLNEEEQAILNEFIAHAKALEGKDFFEQMQLLRQWGGAKILYRKSIQEAPAYRLNHEELEKALNEGIEFIENFTPAEILLDEFSHAQAVLSSKQQEIPAKTVLLAIGTQPNTIITTEEPELHLDGNYFRIMTEQPNIFTHLRKDGRAISFLGDLHPDYAGNVVKAMASAKHGVPIISQAILQYPPHNPNTDLFAELDSSLLATIHEVNILAPKIIEVVIHAPSAAKAFQPGQFYRLQNYTNNGLEMEGLALTGAWVDKPNGLLATIVLEMGGSSNLCRDLKVGEPVVLMGPTGTATHIPAYENVLLIGGGLGNAVLFSIGQAMRANNCKVLYFAGYRKLHDRYKIESIEQASDVAVWCCDEGILNANRAQDFAFRGNLIEALEAYGLGELGTTEVALESIDRIIVIGSDTMMKAVAHARHNRLKKFFKSDHIAIGSINSPMQCMMKEICAQCLQKHIDPVTGKESYVFSCSNQDQLLDEVDFQHLSDRLQQNSLSEKICAHYIKTIRNGL